MIEDFLSGLKFSPFADEVSGVLTSKTASHRQYRYGDKFLDDIYFRKAEHGISCRRYFRNISKEEQHIGELGIRLDGIDFGGDPADDYFYHNENPRIYERMTFPIDYKRTAEDAGDGEFDETAGNRWADPGVVVERIGRSPYQPFPAILLSNYQKNNGLVHGTLSQKVFFHNYLVKHGEGKIRLDIYSGFKGLAYLKMKPGQVLIDEWYLGMVDEAGDFEQVFARFIAELRRSLPPLYGATPINRDNLVWGSWNDGLFRNINEQELVEEAEFLSKNYPTVKWFQVDDGYAAESTRLKIAHGLGMPYEGENGVDKNKFPHGLKYFTDRIKETGLRPAVWIGGFCPKGTPIYQDHPEWFCNYDYRVTKTAPLDVSRPEVREYMEKALDTFFGEYGFEGMKHDFWSYAFEDSHDLLANKDASGYQWREWWLKEVRKRIPDDAYLQTGCDIVMGNPFLAQYFTNYRYGIDIGSGNWDFVKINFLWGIACFSLHIGDLFVPNSDSVGLLPGLNDTDAMFCLNYCMVTHSMVELAGLLSKHQDHPRVKLLKKLICNPNNGQDVFLVKYDYRAKDGKLPRILYFNTPHFSTMENNPSLPLKTVGLFNAEDRPVAVEFSPADLKLENGQYRLTDIWNDRQFEFNGSIKFELAAHESLVMGISPVNEQPQLLDADVKVLNAKFAEGRMSLEFAYEGELRLTFDRPARGVSAAEMKIDDNKLSGKLSSIKTLTIEF